MTGGESTVGNADLDALLLDFMRVLRVYYNLNSSYELKDQHSQQVIDFSKTPVLYKSLGLTPQTPEVQWMLLLKLCREFAAEFSGTTKKQEPVTQADIIYKPWYDLGQLDSEVFIDVIPVPFLQLYERISPSLPDDNPSTNGAYTCRLYLEDNQAFVNINGADFTVAGLHEDSLPSKLLTNLYNNPPGRLVTARDMSPSDDSFSFKQFLRNYNLRWLEPFLSIYTVKAVSVAGAVTLSEHELCDLVKKIKEKSRKDIIDKFSLELAEKNY